MRYFLIVWPASVSGRLFTILITRSANAFFRSFNCSLRCFLSCCAPSITPQSALRDLHFSDSHDVVAAVDVDGFAGDAACEIADEKEGRVAHFGGGDIAFER